MTLPPTYFDDLYRDNQDPWGFQDRPYERRKRALTLAALPDTRYATAFEPGCSIGVLSVELASRCDALLAADVSAAAVAQARRRVPAHVTVEQLAVPDQWPAGRFGLIVLSEMAYYLDLPACRELALLATTRADVLLALHWRHPVEDYPLSGDTVHDELAAAAATAGLARLVHHEEADLLLDVWSADPRSVAARTGLVS